MATASLTVMSRIDHAGDRRRAWLTPAARAEVPS